MVVGTGFGSKATFTKEAGGTTPVWPSTAPQAGAALLPLLSETMQEQRSRLFPQTASGFSTPETPVDLEHTAGGVLRLLATYQGLDALWACSLGHQPYRRDDTLQPATLEAGAYRHRFELAPSVRSQAWKAGTGWRANEGLTAGQQLVRRGTLVLDKQASTWEFLSCMVAGFTFACSPASVTLALQLLAYSLNRASATNPHLNSLTDPGFTPLRFADLTCRFGAFSTSTALSSSDDLQLLNFRLALHNNLLTPRQSTSLKIGEPERGTLPRLTGELRFRRYSDDTLADWLDNQTPLMASLTFTGPTIAATSTAYRLALYLPTLLITRIEAGIPGPGFIPLIVQFRAQPPTGAAAGMPSLALGGPLLVECVNANSSHSLA